MSSDNSNNWIADTVCDFIHSPIWAAPVHTFIEARCAAFDYDDDEDQGEETNATSSATSLEEQMNIHEQYTRLVDALILNLGRDLGLDQDDLNKVCQIPTDSEQSVMVDESFEQLYAARDFPLFQEMMRRKNLILQLQALVSLQLQWGLLRQSDTGDDLVLSLLMQATASPVSAPGATPPQRRSIAQSEQTPVVKQEIPQKKIQVDYDDDDDVVAERRPSPTVSKVTHQRKEKKEPKKPVKEEVHLPGLRQRRGENLDTDWYRNLRQNVSQKNNKNDDDDEEISNRNSTPQSIGAVSQEVLREKLRQLTDQTSLVDEKTAAAIRERKDFLKRQRDAIVEKQKNERAQDLEQETQQQEQQTTRPARPQSAAFARKAMATNQNTQQPQISNEELNRRRIMADKLRREVVDKR